MLVRSARLVLKRIRVKGELAGRLSGGEEIMAMLFFLATGWLALRYPLPIFVVVGVVLLLQRTFARGNRLLRWR
jgi:hypothetical protein